MATLMSPGVPVTIVDNFWKKPPVDVLLWSDEVEEELDAVMKWNFNIAEPSQAECDLKWQQDPLVAKLVEEIDRMFIKEWYDFATTSNWWEPAGLKRGEFDFLKDIVVRPSEHKTNLAYEQMMDAIKENKQVVYFDTEATLDTSLLETMAICYGPIGLADELAELKNDIEHRDELKIEYRNLTLNHEPMQLVQLGTEPKGSHVTELPGGQHLGELSDLNYFQNKVMASSEPMQLVQLGTPKEREDGFLTHEVPKARSDERRMFYIEIPNTVV